MNYETRVFSILLGKMLREVEDILVFTRNFSREQFAADTMTQKAVAMSFANLGEYAKAARRKCPDSVQTHPEIPFDIMAGFRNAAAHEYYKIDFGTLYATIQRDIPNLRVHLQNAIGSIHDDAEEE